MTPMPSIKRLGVLTGGGDAPGLNAVIRAVVKASINHDIEVLGIEDSFGGLIDPSRCRPLRGRDVTGILRIGGTVLGTTNRGDPFKFPDPSTGELHDLSAKCVRTFYDLGLDALIVIGGDGTLAIGHDFWKLGLPIVGVPKTIDNDIVGTLNCFGFDTAVQFATEAIDRLHTTAESHHRVMVVEVMGRSAGWIALHAGVAGGADVILIPEIPFNLDAVAARVRQRDAWGAHFSIVVVAEGAKPVGGGVELLAAARPGVNERLGGMAQRVAAALEPLAGKECRSVVLGHLQRGGAPTSFDRVLSTRFGAKAVDLVIKGHFGKVVVSRPPVLDAVPLEDVVRKIRNVPLDSDLMRAARSMGICFGDGNPADHSHSPV
jgi:phosphofructokinase-like protein